MRFKILGIRELNRVRSHDRQLQAGSQLHGIVNMVGIVRASGALQLDVKAIRENGGHLPCQFFGTRPIVLQQGLPDGSRLRTGKRD